MEDSRSRAPGGWAVRRTKRVTRDRFEAGSDRPLGDDATSQECRELLMEQLGFVDRTVRSIARRHALPPWEIDDFGSQVKMRMISNDYGVLRSFQGKSLLTTYLTTVIQNLFRDFRIQKWGKWRASAVAKGMGEVGVRFEALLYRDNFSFDEASAILRARSEEEITDEELIDMATRIRPRASRRYESDGVLSRLRGPERGDQSVVDSERAETLTRLESALRAVLSGLDTEDRLILRLRFSEGFTIRSIAATLDFDRRRIYSRVRRLLCDVRERIEAEGVRCEDVLDVLDWPAGAVEAGLSDVDEGLSRQSA